MRIFKMNLTNYVVEVEEFCRLRRQGIRLAKLTKQSRFISTYIYYIRYILCIANRVVLRILQLQYMYVLESTCLSYYITIYCCVVL